MSFYMKKNILGIFCALLIQIPTVYAANWSTGNPFVEMMRSMLNMFEVMQLYQDYSGQSNLSGMPQPFSPGQFGSPPFAQPHTDALKPPTSDPSLSSPATSSTSIDGLWLSDANTLLLINGDYAQIYWSRTQYRNYYLHKGANQLIFKDAESGQLQTYDMATQAKQLVLRDEQGSQLLFRKLSKQQF